MLRSFSILLHDINYVSEDKSIGIFAPHEVHVIECLERNSKFADHIRQGAEDPIDILQQKS
jgi:hypothetical protein